MTANKGGSEMLPFNNVLVFGAHPDDELLMANTIAKFSSNGVHVTVATVTDGSEGYSDIRLKNKIVRLRKEEAAVSDSIIGVGKRIFMGFEDQALTNDKKTLRAFIRLIRQVRPQAIFTHGPHDNHRDHRATNAISADAWVSSFGPVAMDLGKPCPRSHLYYYQGLTQSLPTVLYDVTDFSEKYAEAWLAQKSQLDGEEEFDPEINRKNLQNRIRELRANRPRKFDKFCIAEATTLGDFLWNPPQ